MVDLHWKTNMVNSDMSPKSPRLSKPSPRGPSLHVPFSTTADFSAAPPPLCAAYDQYLRLPELRKLWSQRDFPNWNNEPILKPALQALEITFRFLSTVSSDPRPYANRRECNRRIESLATYQVEIISILCEDEEQDAETRGRAPTADLAQSGDRISYSECSLLPRLATWRRSKDAAQRILLTVECQMTRCPYTLGLGEPNLSGKPSLLYDAVCRPRELHALQTTPLEENFENVNVHAAHQISESWIRVTRKLLERICGSIEGGRFEKAASDLDAVERIWKLLGEVTDVHVAMDPNDFLKLMKSQLAVRSLKNGCGGETVPFCFRSRELVEVARMCRELREKVPEVVGAEADPKGGPRIQEAAMRLYAAAAEEREKVEVLQGMQAVEKAMKGFFFGYKQVVAAVMGSVEASGNRVGMSCESGDSLSQIFMEPTYFPSLDAAKTFLGYFWDSNNNNNNNNDNGKSVNNVVVAKGCDRRIRC
ncbi:hypothetical protein PIB30_023731 [Stylosanthes scabra]|uniref:Nematode resistance protein-like HSPRO2 n=1 Tax=Stylosanthes scabra TaxID=79078 RepID=A0ABU6V9T8_9FABA|nr:hypothetical protein [Stylosanthes scabra]